MAMGRTHAWTGVAAFLAASPVVDHFTPMSTPELIAGTLVCAGGALLPDLDHPSGTIAHSFGPVTKLLAHITSRLFGGHRNGTHSFLFVGIVLVLSTVAGTLGGWWIVVPVFLAAELAIGVLWRSRGLGNEILGAGVAAAVYNGHLGTGWLGWALTIGTAAHMLLGDCFTPERCPLWWPLSKRRYGFDLFTTDSVRESWYALAVKAAVVAMLLIGTDGVSHAVGWWPYAHAAVSFATGGLV